MMLLMLIAASMMTVMRAMMMIRINGFDPSRRPVLVCMVILPQG